MVLDSPQCLDFLSLALALRHNDQKKDPTTASNSQPTQSAQSQTPKKLQKVEPSNLDPTFYRAV